MVEPHAARCLEGTRTKLLADIATNTDDPDGANVIWILGAPGSGKSSLSLTTKSLLQRQRRLVTYFRFDRNEATTTTPTALWRRVAYDLGRRIPELRAQLLQQLRDDEVDLDSPMDVFSFLVEDSFSNLTSAVARPLVIIIDALDECGGLAGSQSPDRQTLLRTIKRWKNLPKYFKLLVTSRPEGDIERVLSSISTPIEIYSGNFLDDNPRSQETVEIDKDVRMFLDSRFEQIRVPSSSLSSDWPGQDIVTKMVCRANGNFMWAMAATSFIFSGIHPQERLDAVMSDASQSVGMQPLYSLYSTILDISFKNIGSDSREAEVLRAVLGVIIFAQRPFDDIEYTKLPTTTPVSLTAVEMIRDRLRSVVGQNQSLRFVHKSFDDFLVSKECPTKYAVRKGDAQYLLTNLCSTRMMKELHFNMCNLKTSCLKNKDVPDIRTKVSNGIPPLLAYSCFFLADHLSQSPFNQHLMGQVKEMVMDKLLYWFEAMSILRGMNQVSHSLILILKWLHLSPDEEFKSFVYDAYRFIRAFALPIAESAPHLYISALPFAPQYSLVAKHFLPRFPWTIALSTGKPTNWSSCFFTSERHDDVFQSIAFSPDEKYFVSGSLDKTIYVYDSETGNVVSGPYRTDLRVFCVFFDPDGRRVWASYEKGKVICWDIKSGEKCLVFHTLQDSEVKDNEVDDTEKLPVLGYSIGCLDGDPKILSADNTGIALWSAKTGRCEYQFRHQERGYVWPRVSVSPNGSHIACATLDDRIIRFWSVVGGSEIRGPVHSYPQFKHTRLVSALSFSVDGDFAVSGGLDGDILIWDARTGDTVGPPLNTGFGVCGVAYSPNNHLLVASAFDTCAVMAWDSLTHEAVLGPLEGHSQIVHSIILSRDGRKALTAAMDKTIRMWDLGRKDVVVPVTQVSEGHSYPVLCVAFSPSEERLISLDTFTFRVWDVDHPGRPILKRRTPVLVTRLILSPDGSQIVLYSHTNQRRESISIWNTDTGKLACQLDLIDYQHTPILYASFRSSDKQLVLCSSDGVVSTWNLQDHVPQVLAKLPDVVALAPDGMTVVVRDSNGNPRHYMWSTTTQQHLPFTFADDKTISIFGDFRAVVYSPSGRFLGTVHPHEGQHMLRVWNTQTGAVVAHHSTLRSWIHALAFSPNNHYVAIACQPSNSNNTAIFIYDICTGRMSSGPWGGHSGIITTLAFSTSGEILASGSLDRQVRVWNMDDLLGDLSDHVLGVGTYMTDGWIKNSEGELLFWVPKEHRPRLVWPHSVLLDGIGSTTELDPSKFRYGEHWTECFAEGD